MAINASIFREYDIRGLIDDPNQLSPNNLFLLGRGVGTYFIRAGIRRAVVGHDSRPYSSEVQEHVIKGLNDCGVDTIEIGQLLTPIFYFAQYHLKERGGVMVSASHNPYGWTGLKIANDYSTTFAREEIQDLAALITAGRFATGAGKRETYPDIVEAYTKNVLGRVRFARPMKVLVDAGNGTAGPIVPAIFRTAGHTVVERHCDLDPTFPNHEPNPSVLEAAEDIGRGVRESGAEVGFGFDDDGDRLGVADDRGSIVWPDRILAFLARLALRERPGAAVVFDVKCSQALIEDIEQHGGRPVMWKTGHSFIKQKSKEVDAAIAGERSGHIFIRQGYYGFDDATFAALKLLEYLSTVQKPFSALVGELPQYVTSPVWQPACADEVKYSVVERLTALLKEEYGLGRVIDINGARVQFDDGWGLVRASSNLPVLVLVFEAKTKTGVERIEKIFREKLKQFPEVSEEWKTG